MSTSLTDQRGVRRRLRESAAHSWDDYLLLGTPPERTNYYLRRRSVLLEHRAPRRPSNLPRQTLELGRTVALPIMWSGAMLSQMRLAPIRAGSITVTEQFRQKCELTGDVRSVHAIEALQRPSAVVNYQLGEVTILLVTRRVTLASHPYTLLVIASVRDMNQTDILLGFRIYDGDDSDLANNPHPFDVFMVLLKRYGVSVEVGNHHGLFIPRANVEIPPGGVQQLVRGQMPKEEHILVHALIKVRDTTPGTADVAWAFAILIGRYRSDIRRHKR
jgi:hypothetical protein